jgi:CheY-like chemotaxis protein
MARPRILVVDDSETVLMVLEAGLADHFDVETAPDGLRGLERAREWRPDLVVTDSLMPGLDGFGLLNALAAHPDTSPIPVIVLTAERIADLPAAQTIRPSAILMKSMDLEPLIAAIRGALIHQP